MASRYLFPTMSGIIVLATCLQLFWLDQLFKKQSQVLEEELEQVVNNASREAIYDNLFGYKNGKSDYRYFFLSQEWTNLKTAFDAITDSKLSRRLNSSFSSYPLQNSVVVDLHFQIHDQGTVSNQPMTAPVQTKQTNISSSATDQQAIVKIDSIVKVLLKQADLNMPSYYITYRYQDNEEQKTYSTRNYKAEPAYRSHKYSYSLRSKNKYQLAVPGLNGVVIWRMRIYICSAAVLILLIGFACYAILKSIANKQLYEEAKAAFTSNMSHELKTPLAIIEVALDSITRYNLVTRPEKLENYLEISKTELQRLKQIIDKALRLDDIDKGIIKLHQELYDIQQCVKQVVAAMNVQVTNKKATIFYEPSAGPCFVNGDPVHLTNVFYNLIENALKYGQRGVHIEVACTCNSDLAKIAIKDDGPGIEAVYHDKIFERFFRIPGADDMAHEAGSGLGLNYVRQIVEMHGGRVNIQSEPEKGSKFMVYLPIFKDL